MPKPACILFLLDWRPVSWSTREEFFRQLSQRLYEQGITPVLTVSETVSEDVRQRFEAAGARVISCSYHAHPLRYWAQIQDAVKRYSVLVAHIRFFDYFTAVSWMCRLSGIRTVMFTEANSGEWNGRGWKSALIRLRAAVMCRPLVRFIAISEFIRDRLEAVGIAPQKIAVVYNGVDLASFRPDPDVRAALRGQTGARPDTVVLIFISAFLAWKRPEIALETCAAIAGQSADVQLWMLGEGPLREDLEATAVRLGITNRVRWLGHQKDPHQWLAAADVFLHTSIGEAFGNVLVEAMGCGVPVAATRSGATSELILEGETGILISPGPQEAHELAAGILKLVRDPQRYSAMGEAARLQAKRFSIEKCVERTLAVYEPYLRDDSLRILKSST